MTVETDWIIAIATPSSIGIGFLATWYQVRQTRKIEEQKFFLEIDKKLMSEENLDVSSKIQDEVYESKTFVINNVTIEEDVSNYLNDLEYICNLYDIGIISQKQLHILNGYQITDAFKCKSVQEHIEKIKKKMKKDDVWEIFLRIAKVLESTPQK